MSWPFNPNDDTLVVNTYKTGSPYGATDNYEVLDDIAEKISLETDEEAQHHPTHRRCL